MDTEIEKTRERILEAANARFGQYGYETTMNEISADCDMSAANLYRFFDNKQEIGATLVGHYFTKEAGKLREIVRRPGPASVRLKDFALALLEHTYSRTADQTKISELVEMICTERFDVLELHVRTKRSLLAELLATGNASGEFDVADCDKTAAAISTALILFDVPIFMKGPREELQCRAETVVELLLQGLKKG
jgi:AcrR family transcriptional regulator